MLHRKWFFWIEKLKITPAERRSIMILFVLLLATTLIVQMPAEQSQVDVDQYEALEAEFKRMAIQAEKEEDELLARYDPRPLPAASTDTVTNDSLPPDTLEETNGKKININTAEMEKLKSLPGIGPVYARRIIQYRDEHGRFRDVSDLIKIKGIGEKRLEKLKPLVEI